MSRVGEVFKQLRDNGRCGLVAYVTCGAPDRETTVRIIEALARAGADAIELGVPFSDPIADGPVIQAASQRALKNGTKISDIFWIADRVKSVPLIAFSYLNPILRYGVERFESDARAAGIDSLLLTDLPVEEAPAMKKKLRLPMVFLLAPTSTDERIRAVNRMSDDFIYYVSTTGVTGARKELDPTLLAHLDGIRKKVTKPLAVGFGISEHAHYEALRTRCNAIVVGSAIMRAIGDRDAAGAPDRAAAVVHRILDNARR